ncbi:glycosyltransferase family 2 protein [Larkinella sp. VNQ87]|uniref:glycosyltransferase family 2 protein n=1 Tax=Larkinella sp. VNQ87 TaxID=3400921 RepID=UPI003C04CC2E
MPVYNGERFLSAALDSLLAQTYQNFEVLVLDNGSTDGTRAILETYARRDQRIKPLYEQAPLGYGGEVATNVATRHARGEFLAKLDADDVAHPERLARQVAFLQANPDIFLVGSWLKLIDETGKKTGTREYPVDHPAIYDEFYLRFPIANPAILYRNRFREQDFYQIRFRHFNDYYSLFVQLNQGRKMHNLPEYLTAYRIHNANTVFTKLQEKWRSNLQIKETFVREFGYKPPLAHRLKIKLITLVINTLPESFLIRIMNRARRLLNA